VTTKLTEKNISSVTNTGVSWQSVIIADGSTGTTGVSGRGYFINTTSAAHTFTLPATATFGDSILIKDYAGTFATFNLTINRNGNNIQGVANNSLINTNRASVVLVYVDVTRGWEFVNESNVADLQGPTFISATGGTITTSGNFKIHSFTGDGCFVVSTIGNPVGGGSNVDYLVVAGGGGGGGVANSGFGGAGGAGGFRTTFPSPGCNAGSFPITLTTFPITVGAGGAGGGSNNSGSSGTPAVFSTITSTGGGGGGRAVANGGSGGSGGGGGIGNPGPVGSGAGTGGAGNTPPVSPSQGNNGGNGATTSGSGGGGGAGGAAGNASNNTGGNAGTGSSNSITGSSVGYAGGGAGYGQTASGSPAGPFGGGQGLNFGPASIPGGNGTDNTGGGAGGGDSQTGGKGIVIIRYKFQ